MRTRPIFILVVVLAAILSVPATAQETPSPAGPPGAASRRTPDQLARLPGAIDTRRATPTPAARALARSRAAGQDTVDLIVGLRTVWAPDAVLTAEERSNQRAELHTAERDLLARLGPGVVARTSFDGFVPHVPITVPAERLDDVLNSPAVASVEPVIVASASLEQSGPLIGAPASNDLGFDGDGQAVAILDTGVESSHSFLAGRVVAEACFSIQASCPNGSTSQTGSGAGRPCSYAPDGCAHGTHVAGIAAGSGQRFSGVAPAADIVAIQVFSRFDGNDCVQARAPSPCALANPDDQIRAMNHVLELSNQFDIAAVNMSLGSAAEIPTACDDSFPSYAAAISQLTSAGIAVVIASGNEGHDAGVGFPACMSQAVTVGNTTKLDTVAVSSNHASLVDLLAPGTDILSSVPGDRYASFTGTSMAAPQVAGAFAVLGQRAPSASVSTLLSALSSTGVPIGDPRNTVVRPRIQVDAALTTLGADLDQTQPGGLCPTDDVREGTDEQSYPIVNGRTEYGVICADDSDWFVFPGGQGSEITVQLDFDHASGDLDLELWDANEALLRSESETDNETINGTVNVADTYYVRVYGFQGAQNDYELTVSYTSCPPDDEFENNDDLTTARSLDPGTTVFGEACANDPDIYRIDLAAGTPVAAKVDFLHRYGDVDAYLFDSSGSLVATSYSVDDNEYVNYTAPSTGAYYLWVEGYAGDQNSYRLTVTSGSLCPGNDPYEPNDDQIRAVEPGQIVSAVACPGESDWYGIEMQPGMTLDLDLEFDHAQGDLDMYLWNPSSEQIGVADSVSDDEHLSTTADESGTYYIHVAGFEGATNTYQLTFTTGLSNDDRANALTLSGSSGDIEGTTLGATTEDGEPQHAGVPNSGSAWYRWQAPVPGQAVFHTHGSDIDTILAIYREENGSLTEVASNDDVEAGLLTSHSGHFSVASGDELWIAVDTYPIDYYAPQGRFELHWRIDDNDSIAADPDSKGATEEDPGQIAWTTPRGRDIAATCDDRQSSSFDDIEGNVHAYSIRCVAGYDVTVGTGDGSTYSPRGNLSLGQTATFVLNALSAGGIDVPPADGEPCGSQRSTHTASIERLVDAGIMSLSDCGAANSVISRGRMSQLVHDALVDLGGVPLPDETQDRDYYPDDNGHIYEPHIDGITALGIVTGNADGTFGPDTSLTRAQMATFLARCVDALLDRNR